MTAYMVVIYVAFFVFLATVLILNAVFIPQIANAGAGATTAEGGDSALQQGATTVNAQLIPEVRFIYLASALIHGLGDGITAGMLENGQVANGLRHSITGLLPCSARRRTSTRPMKPPAPVTMTPCRSESAAITPPVLSGKTRRH